MTGKASRDAASGPSRTARAAFAAAVVLYAATAAWLIWRTAILRPYSDMFDWIVRHDRLHADGDFLAYLWAPHNLHHLAWTFLVLDLDIRVFRASSYLFLAVGTACLVATAAMLAVAAARVAPPGFRLIGAGGAAALGLMGCHVLDASSDINTTYLHALVFAVGAVMLWEAAPGGRGRTARRVAALFCAMAAGLGNAAGLAVWPALLFGGWRRGERGWALAVLVAGLAFGLVYALGERGPLNPAGHGSLLIRAADAAALLSDYLGLPWVRGLPWARWVIGPAALAASAVVLGLGARDAAAGGDRTAARLVLFSLGTAAMVAVGRSGGANAGLAPMRYAVFMIPLHAGIWIMLLPRVAAFWPRAPRVSALGLLAVAVLMLAHQGAMTLYAVRTADTIYSTIDDFQAGRLTPQMSTIIYPDLAKARAIEARLRRDGLYQRELRAIPAS
ncbi:MAG: hypothetical protein ACXU8S_15795 [Phenylobacterium sp.]